MELIPNLPNDLALACLTRVPYDQFSTLLSTCKKWKAEIELPEFFHLRKASFRGQKLVVMAQARVDLEMKQSVEKGCFFKAVYGLSVLEPKTGKWVDLPLDFPDEFSGGLPYFCRIVAVGYELVIMGGLNTVTWESSGSVFVYNFLTTKWRRGADMPGVRRLMFGCCASGGDDRMVYVAGGHDGEKNALRSALAYDVANDEWIPLPDMARERDECKGVFHRGKFHVIGGYCTDMQGQFEKSAEAFDIATWKWDHVQGDFLESNTCPRTCIGGNDVDMYMICEGDVVALTDGKWKAIAKLPGDMCKITYMTTWQDKLLAIGSSRFDGPHNAYVLNLKKFEWTKLNIPEKHQGHVQSGCYLEI